MCIIILTGDYRDLAVQWQSVSSSPQGQRRRLDTVILPLLVIDISHYLPIVHGSITELHMLAEQFADNIRTSPICGLNE